MHARSPGRSLGTAATSIRRRRRPSSMDGDAQNATKMPASISEATQTEAERGFKPTDVILLHHYLTSALKWATKMPLHYRHVRSPVLAMSGMRCEGECECHSQRSITCPYHQLPVSRSASFRTSKIPFHSSMPRSPCSQLDGQSRKSIPSEWRCERHVQGQRASMQTCPSREANPAFSAAGLTRSSSAHFQPMCMRQVVNPQPPHKARATSPRPRRATHGPSSRRRRHQ